MREPDEGTAAATGHGECQCHSAARGGKEDTARKGNDAAASPSAVGYATCLLVCPSVCLTASKVGAGRRRDILNDEGGGERGRDLLPLANIDVKNRTSSPKGKPTGGRTAFTFSR